MPDYINGQIFMEAEKMFRDKVDRYQDAVAMRDNQWLRHSFAVLPNSNTVNAPSPLADVDIKNRSFNTAIFKYSDSSLGGNACINPPPQFTPYADIPNPGILPGATDITLEFQRAPTGMGEMYSEVFDDNNQIVHFQFGVPQFNSLTQFFTGFYNDSLAGLARTARFDDSFITKFLNFGLDIIRVAIIPLTILPIIFMQAGNAIRFFLKMPSSKFCYLKPAMPLYWNAVSSMVNQIGVNMGIISYMSSTMANKFLNTTLPPISEQTSIFSSIFPEFSKDGVLDVYAVANRYARLEARHRRELVKRIEGTGTEQSFYDAIRQTVYSSTGLQMPGKAETSPFSLEKYWDKYKDADTLSKSDSSLVEKDIRRIKDVSGMDQKQAEEVLKGDYAPEVEQSAMEKVIEYFMANASDGSEYASFRVNYNKSVQESFSNQSAPNGLAQQLNAASSSAREKRMSFADGKVMDVPIISEIFQAVGTVISGGLDMLKLGGIMAFGGNAFVDIPENWMSSQANLPKGSYTIDLVTPYGNPISRFMDIYVPLAMILCGTLPIATGKQSYQSPFYCSLFDRGRVISRFCLIENVTVERGIHNLSFNDQEQAMGIRVTIDVKDLSSVMTLPIQQGAGSMPLSGIFDGENSQGDYMMTLGGLALREVTDRWPIFTRQLSLKRAEFSSFFSASHLASWLGGGLTGTMASVLMQGTNKT